MREWVGCVWQEGGSRFFARGANKVVWGYVRVVSLLCAKRGAWKGRIEEEQACAGCTKRGRERKNKRSALPKGLPVARESDTDKTKPSCENLLDAVDKGTDHKGGAHVVDGLLYQANHHKRIFFPKIGCRKHGGEKTPAAGRVNRIF